MMFKTIMLPICITMLCISCKIREPLNSSTLNDENDQEDTKIIVVTDTEGFKEPLQARIDDGS